MSHRYRKKKLWSTCFSRFCAGENNMQRIYYTNAERAQCAVWVSKGYRATSSQRFFQYSYGRSPKYRFTVRQWRDEYQTRGSHNHRGGNGRPRIVIALRNEIRELFLDGPRIYPRAAAQTGVSDSTAWSVIPRELRLCPYKLRMITALTEQHERCRPCFARECQKKLRVDSGYLE